MCLRCLVLLNWCHDCKPMTWLVQCWQPFVQSRALQRVLYGHLVGLQVLLEKGERADSDRVKAMNFVQEHAARGEVVTGLLYVDPDSSDLHEHLNTVAEPLNRLSARELCPGSVALEKINASLR